MYCDTLGSKIYCYASNFHNSESDWRWYVSDACSTELRYACQSTTDPDDWRISASALSYDPSGEGCPSGYKFSVPQDGFRHQKVCVDFDLGLREKKFRAGADTGRREGEPPFSSRKN